MPRVALRFAYLGRLFDGYARQPDPRLRTVEGALLERLVGTTLITDAKAARFASGSRTDRGVSARMNVCVFDTQVPAGRVVAAVATKTPGLWPLAAAAVPDEWDPRRPEWREYRYHLYGPLRPDATRAALEAAFQPFVGEHDFTAFCKMEAGRDPKRVVHAIRVEEDPYGPVVVVRGRDFLWRMVRRMVAAGLGVVEGRARQEEIEAALRTPAGARDLGTAPAWPLVLWELHYPHVEWMHDEATETRVADQLSWRSAHLQMEQGFLVSIPPQDRG